MSLSKSELEMLDELFMGIQWFPSPSARLTELGVGDKAQRRMLKQLKGKEVERAQQRKADAEAQLQRLQVQDPE